MSVPLDVTSTLLDVTCCRKNGLYGTRTRDSGFIARVDEQVEPERHEEDDDPER